MNPDNHINDNNPPYIQNKTQNLFDLNEQKNINSNINLNKSSSNDANVKNNSKYKNIIKKIFITLSIIVSIIGGGSSVYLFGSCIYYIIKDKSVDPLLNIVVFFGILILLATVTIIASIWIVYAIINLLYKIYIKLKNKHQNIFGLIFLIIIVIIPILLNRYNYNNKNYHDNKNLAEVLNKPPNYEYYDTTSYYFIYNNKIYYYTLENNSNYTKLYDRFFVMNLDGTENKKLAETDELRYATFYFVYNNEAYYYTMYYRENKKINLSTGEITSLGNDDIYIGKTLKDGKANVFIDYATAGNDYSIFKKIDLTTNRTIYETKTKHSIAGNEYYLDYDGGNIYYLETFYTKFPTIYKNKDIIYQFTDKKDKDIKFIAVNKDYLYYKSKNNIYKLNTNSKKIEKEIYYNLNNIQRISSGTNYDNYYYTDGKIYEFDLNNDKFNLILEDIENKPEDVYNINGKLIFTENTNNLNYTSNNLGSVIVYNISNKDIKKFDRVRKVSFDEKCMYLLIDNTENYAVQKYELN